MGPRRVLSVTTCAPPVARKKRPGASIILQMLDRVFDVHYADSRTAVVIKANLYKGWEKLEKTYGFFRQTRIPYRGDLNIRVQLAVIAQPASFHDWASEFPDLDLHLLGSTRSYVIEDRILTVKVSLSPDQPWRTTGRGRPEIYVEELPLLTRDDGGWYDLRAWIIFHEPARPPIPDVRAWVENKLFVPGGHIESNRRRH